MDDFGDSQLGLPAHLLSILCDSCVGPGRRERRVNEELRSDVSFAGFLTASWVRLDPNHFFPHYRAGEVFRPPA